MVDGFQNATNVQIAWFGFYAFTQMVLAFYVNTWGEEAVPTSYYGLCDEAIRGPFTQYELGVYYAKDGIMKSQ